MASLYQSWPSSLTCGLGSHASQGPQGGAAGRAEIRQAWPARCPPAEKPDWSLAFHGCRVARAGTIGSASGPLAQDSLFFVVVVFLAVDCLRVESACKLVRGFVFRVYGLLAALSGLKEHHERGGALYQARPIALIILHCAWEGQRFPRERRAEDCCQVRGACFWHEARFERLAMECAIFGANIQVSCTQHGHNVARQSKSHLEILRKGL